MRTLISILVLILLTAESFGERATVTVDRDSRITEQLVHFTNPSNTYVGVLTDAPSNGLMFVRIDNTWTPLPDASQLVGAGYLEIVGNTVQMTESGSNLLKNALQTVPWDEATTNNLTGINWTQFITAIPWDEATTNLLTGIDWNGYLISESDPLFAVAPTNDWNSAFGWGDHSTYGYGDVFAAGDNTFMGDNIDRKSTRLNSSHKDTSRMPSSA